ncbi:MAG: type II secretion system protein M [Oleispira sp.]|nr:type II secretion system protein M [Oleispira sp.]MBL4880706.1 type II secretion system protein M [Oleispira sp.]
MMLWWQKKPIADLIGSYEKTSDREQKIILVCIVSVLSLMLYIVVIEPMFISYQAVSSEQEGLVATNRKLKKQLERTLTKKYQDPNEPLNAELDALDEKSLQLDEDIGRLTKALVAPKQMIKLLENMLKDDRRMKLISLYNLPKENLIFLIEDVETIGDKNEDADEGLIYKHAFEIEMEATYDSTVQYLQRIDKLPWKVFWQDLRYEAKKYPNGKLKIKIYTLSTSREVLGV